MGTSLNGPIGPIQVTIVAGDHMTGELLAGAFNRVRKDFAVATVIGSSEEAIRRLKSRDSHVALICAELQDGPRAGFRVLQSLRSSPHRVASIMLLQSIPGDSAVSAFRAGARGVFYRCHSLKALSKCIRVVHQGQIWASNADCERILDALTNLTPIQFLDKNGHPILTGREEDIVRLIAEGLTNREIAHQLNLAEHTIRNYLSKIYEKLQVSTRVELILYAYSPATKHLYS